MAILRDILLKHLPPGARVWAYGSRARGTGVRRGSDLDLMIDAGAPLGFGAIAVMAEAFSESFVPFIVDLHDWHRADSDFLARIAPDLVPIAPGT